VAGQGTTAVSYLSVDASGNAETVKTATIRIDKSAPQLSLDVAATYTANATIRASASDALSGLDRVELRLDGGSWSTGTQASTSATGTHAVFARAFDVAGNEHDVAATFTVLAAPVTTTTRLGGHSKVRVKRVLALNGTVSSAEAQGLVTITKTRLVGKKWRHVGSVRIPVVDGAFRFDFKPTFRGRWRFVATYSGNVIGATVYESSRSRVKSATAK
jgi:hypothetical protein